MKADYYMKTNDLLPTIRDILKGPDGEHIVLTDGQDIVRFIMRSPYSDTPKVDETAFIVDDEEGIVEYVWQDGDTDEPGRFQFEWEVTWQSGERETFPNDGYGIIKISDDLDSDGS